MGTRLRASRRPKQVDTAATYAKTRALGIAAFTEDRLSAASMDAKVEAALEVRLERYIPRSGLAALSRESRESEKWANEITSCVVMFVNLGISEARLNEAATDASDPDKSKLKFLHDAFGAAQKAVYEYEGSINKWLAGAGHGRFNVASTWDFGTHSVQRNRSIVRECPEG